MKSPNFGYHFARWHGRMRRALYARFLPLIVRRRITPPQTLPFDVFAYSGEATLPEQVKSIRSFLRFAGRPQKFVIVSDGSYSDSSILLLRKIDQSVEVRLPKAGGPSARLQKYLEQHPTGKQLRLIMDLPEERPALYVDSDVLFFEGAAALANFDPGSAPAWYLADCRFSGDERLLHGPEEKRDPVNTGVLFLARRLDWSRSLERFSEMKGEPNFFSNQTMTHLAMHENGARPFDPDLFVLQLDDQFEWRDRYAAPKLVLRHYVNPVRHKFWTA